MKLIIKPQPIATACRAAYIRSDYAVMYSHEPAETYVVRTLADLIDEQFGIRRDWPVEVLADTLAVLFKGPAKELVSFDAYTNWDYWRRRDYLQVPQVSCTGRICLAEGPEDDEINQIELQVEPEYIFCEERRLLQIVLGSPPRGLFFCRVSDKLIVGLTEEQLAVLFLEDLSIE